MGLSRWKAKTSSSKLAWFMVPLVLVSVFVALLGTNNSNSVSHSHSYTRLWSSAITVASNTTPVYSPVKYGSSAEGPVASRNDVEPSLDLQSRTVREDEAISDDYILNASSSSPLTVEAIEIQQPDVDKEESLNITSNGPRIFPASNDSHALPRIGRIQRKYDSLERLEVGLRQARAAIREAKNGNQTYDPDYVPTGPVYRNPNAFHRSYLEMEKQFKIYVYEDGEPPIFHIGPGKSTYAMEGNFIYHMETTEFRTMDPEKAHIYFLPISAAYIVRFVYVQQSHDWHPLKQTFRDYVSLIARKYHFWNRSLGADHFMLACHDWGPELSASVPGLFKNSIRALCNANTSEGFNPTKDVSIPEILLPTGTLDGMTGGPSASKRSILVFFAGGLHGPIRPILLEHWEGKDEDVQVHKYLPKGVSYFEMVRKSKYCICPSGYEVASPRMVEALYTGCVPVLIKDHYVPPFSDVLNWKAFSVEIPVKDIPKMKEILMGISTRQYLRMQRRGKQVRRHFEVNLPPKRYDVFHMILHSAWLRRLNVRVHGIDDS